MLFRVSRKQNNRKAEVILEKKVDDKDADALKAARAEVKEYVRGHEASAGDPPAYEIFSEEVKG